MRLPRLGGFTTFMKKVLDVPAMGVVALGMLLPTAGNYLYNTVANSAMVPTNIKNAMSGVYVQPVVLATASAGIAYLASRFGLVSTSTAVTAAGVSTLLFAVKALQDADVAGSGLFPTFQGAHSMMGYRRNSGYLGYLGNVEAAPEMLPAPVETQLFGSSPSFNIF